MIMVSERALNAKTTHHNGVPTASVIVYARFVHEESKPNRETLDSAGVRSYNRINDRCKTGKMQIKKQAINYYRAINMVTVKLTA